MSDKHKNVPHTNYFVWRTIRNGLILAAINYFSFSSDILNGTVMLIALSKFLGLYVATELAHYYNIERYVREGTPMRTLIF